MYDLESIPVPILAIAAHPEDLEIHAGGIIARLVAAGRHVAYVLCTSGNRGTSAPTQTMAQVGAMREAEQCAAAATLGLDDITFLRHDDGDLAYIPQVLREEIVRLIRQKRPRAIITHDLFPGNGQLDSCSIYPDHLTVGRVVFEAAYVCAPGPLFYPQHLAEGLRPHKPEVLYLIMSESPNFYPDISAVWEQKIRAIHVYQSQGRSLPGVAEFFYDIARRLGERGGVSLAEGFRVLVPS
jgi:LmbE family N-acetylglucosaminyl deacetylase